MLRREAADNGISSPQPAQLIAEDRTEEWILYGALSSGVFIVLTTWATKPART